MHHALKIVTLTSPPFHPLTLFVNGVEGAWYDPSDLTTLFQDSAGTTPVTADGDVVGLVLDKSGNGNNLVQATTANKPLYKTSAGLHWLQFDGTDDRLGSAAAMDMSATDEMTIHAGVRKASDAASGLVCELGTNVIYMFAPLSAATDRYTFFGTTATGYAAPTTNVVTGTIKKATDSQTIFVDGAQKGTSAADLGLGNYPAGATFWVGRRAAGTAPLNGHIYGLIVRGVVSTSAQKASAEAYMAAKTGVTI